MINKLCHSNLLTSEFFSVNNDNKFEFHRDNTIQFDIGAWHNAFLRLKKCILPPTIAMNKIYLSNALKCSHFIHFI